MPKNNKKRFPIPSQRNFAEMFFPARPRKLLSKARTFAPKDLVPRRLGLANASNLSYVRWLKKESMLHNANRMARQYSGTAHMWQKPFAIPQPRSAVSKASVWYTAYPISMITKDKTSILGTFADEALWNAFQEIGIKGLHTGPMKLAGGLDGWKATPSIDGHFDRISNKIDAMFGTEAEFRHMSKMASAHGGTVIDDIVPGHTGKGPDFRLAEMGVGEYPGIYHMIEIDPKEWSLLPDVPKGLDSVNLDADTEEKLKKVGYIIGRLHRVMFYEPGVKETNWSVTRAVKGADGIKRRWVYLHYFKEGQPSLNWLDPSFAGMKLVVGDALHSIGELGSQGLRLDANGFLGIEKTIDDTPAWSEGHPLSEVANQLIAGMVRKMGGFTFQEVNLTMDDIKTMSHRGADLSYDFVSRPAYHHALVTGDTEFLRLTLRYAMEIGIDPASLVHALQNHDELTYELVHFWTTHKDDEFIYHGKTVLGSELRDTIRKDLSHGLTGSNAPYNLIFTTNGIACTTASVITAVLGYKDIASLDDDQVESVKRVHLLLTMFNAFQPGVFALSGWDLSGALTIDPGSVKDLIADGDTRWINRGAYDLMDNNPSAKSSASGMPKSHTLYGTLPQQLADDSSFARQLGKLLAVRDRYSIAISHQLDIPDVAHKGMLVMVHRLGSGDIQVTVLNFSAEEIAATVSSEYLQPHAEVTDMFTDEPVAVVDELHNFPITLHPHQGTSLLVR